jgi:hypothetical protein
MLHSHFAHTRIILPVNGKRQQEKSMVIKQPQPQLSITITKENEKKEKLSATGCILCASGFGLWL